MLSARDEMLGLLDNRRKAYTLPQKFYNDPEFHQLDLQHIWYRDWIFAGHDCQIPRAGDHFTMQLGAYSIIVVRGGDGQIRAFHNTCRHRGARLCLKEHGSSPKLVCPYHQWTYDLDGRLLFARDMGPAFDAGAHGLKPVHVGLTGGHIFVCVAERPLDFEPVRALLEPYMLPHRLREARVAHQTSSIEHGNWKLVMENNRECYHCSGCHPELLRTYLDLPLITGVDAGAAPDPVITGHWQKCEAMGLPSRFNMHESGQYRIVRSPMVGEASSFTMSGKPAVKTLLGDFADPRIGSAMFFFFPNTWNHLMSDHAISFRVLPLGPQETLLTTTWLVNKDAREGIDYDLTELTEVWDATNAQDKFIVEINQQGVNSPAYEPGPYAMAHEDGVEQFVDWYCRFISARLTAGAHLSAVA